MREGECRAKRAHVANLTESPKPGRGTPRAYGSADMRSVALAPEEEQAAPSRPENDEPWGSVDWQRLWLTLQRHQWRTLALVPAGLGGPRELTLDTAVTLARTGSLQFGKSIHVADATELEFCDLNDFVAQLRETLATGPVILALAPAAANAATVQLARSSDLALLCVALKCMRVGEAKRTIEDIGRDRFFGAVTFT